MLGMDFQCALLFVFATTLLGCVSARAVNISNTWVLPEEGFPVFYRYFRDRISWYEADAVCQFHHANLVTVDTTSQYDAIRAFLKELDISHNVWIGLSRTAEKPNFTWTDFRPLSSEGYWHEAVPAGGDPLCTAMDPAADFWWKAMPCGAPTVASFICELSVPSWAMGPNGCLLTELPSLTVLYNPEQSALELTSDCGLDGTKRIACKGNVDREEIMRQLTCTISNDDFDDKSTRQPIHSSTEASAPYQQNTPDFKTTKPWLWTSNTIDSEYGMPTRHRRETEETLSPMATKSTREATTQLPRSTTQKIKSNVGAMTSAADEFAKPEVGLSTQNQRTAEEQAEMYSMASTSTESKPEEAAAAPPEETEYPSAINQGQLFSIIENGTNFDIIELSENGTEGSKTEKASDQKKINPVLSTSSPTTDNSHMTTIYLKESSLDHDVHATNKSVEQPTDLTDTDKKPLLDTTQNLSDKNLKTQSTAKPSPVLVRDYNSGPYPKEVFHPIKIDLNLKPILGENPESSKNIYKQESSLKLEDKSLSKEVDMYSIPTNAFVKLNRTNRKELPMMDEPAHEASHELSQTRLEKRVDPNVTDPIKSEKIIISDKLSEELIASETPDTTASTNITGITAVPILNGSTLIDPKIEELNANTSESFETLIPVTARPLKQTENAPENLSHIQVNDENSPESVHIHEATEEPLEPIPEAPARPNRKRQLQKPKGRSLYPYFFSRVLG